MSPEPEKPFVQNEMPQPTAQPKGIRRRFAIIVTVACLCIVVVVGWLFPAIKKVREAASRMQSSGQLCQIGLAMLNYDSEFGHLPPQAICDKEGNKLLSWRVAILPYIEQHDLYAKFKLNEPWDSPHNAALIPAMPKSFVLPKDDKTKGLTHFKVFVGNSTVFEMEPAEDNKYAFKSVWSIESLMKTPRGHSNRILCVQAGEPVIWTKPDDIEYDPNQPFPQMKPVYSGGMLALMADGHVTSIRKGTRESTWKASIDPNSTSKESLDQ